MFYDVYSSLCKKNGKKASVVAAELGINKSNVSNWKNNGYTPRGEALQKIADYFGVTTDFLLGNEKTPPVNQERLGEIFSLSDIEKQIILAYRNADEAGRIGVLRMLQIEEIEEKKIAQVVG